MYSTCIHCQRDLGRNQLIEHLPVGRRIAFDEATARLWVVCAACARWNLVPFESRLEAIETGEKLYRAATRRMSTGEIGLAQTCEGTELVRIGAPLRPEMAAWRYGRLFKQRYWKYGAGLAPFVLLSLLGNSATLTASLNIGSVSRESLRMLMLVSPLAMTAGTLLQQWRWRRKVVTLSVGDHTTSLSQLRIASTRVAQTTEGALRIWLPVLKLAQPRSYIEAGLRADAGAGSDGYRIRQFLLENAGREISHHAALEGSAATAGLRVILPLINRQGGTGRMVKHALTHLEENASDPRQVVFGGRRAWEQQEVSPLSHLHVTRRLALEMSVHEGSERRWLAGELLELETEWRKANEIAAIADALLRDPAIESRLDALRARTTSSTPP